MARKFERPPNFSGASEEDVVEFIQRYEQVAKYNGWNTVTRVIEGMVDSPPYTLAIRLGRHFWGTFQQMSFLRNEKLLGKANCALAIVVTSELS